MRLLMHERGYKVASTERLELSLEQIAELPGCPVLKLIQTHYNCIRDPICAAVTSADEPVRFHRLCETG